MSEFPHDRALAAMDKAVAKIEAAKKRMSPEEGAQFSQKTKEVATALLEKIPELISLDSSQKRDLGIEKWEEVQKIPSNTDKSNLSPREIALSISLHEKGLLPGDDTYITIVDTREELSAAELTEVDDEGNLAEAA